MIELVGSDGAVISSAQWPERVGNKEDLVAEPVVWNQQSAFLSRVELADSVDLGIIAVRAVRAGTRNIYIVGGRRLDSDFLRSLVTPPGMRALLYRNLEQAYVPAALRDADGPVSGAEGFGPAIDSLKQAAILQNIEWTTDAATPEHFISLPLWAVRAKSLALFWSAAIKASWLSRKHSQRRLACRRCGRSAGLCDRLVDCRARRPSHRAAYRSPDRSLDRRLGRADQAQRHARDRAGHSRI